MDQKGPEGNLIVAVNRQNRSKKQDGCLAIWSCRAREKKGGQKEVRTGPPTLGELTSCPLVPTTTPALSCASRAITTHLIVSKATYEPLIPLITLLIALAKKMLSIMRTWYGTYDKRPQLIDFLGRDLLPVLYSGTCTKRLYILVRPAVSDVDLLYC